MYQLIMSVRNRKRKRGVKYNRERDRETEREKTESSELKESDRESRFTEIFFFYPIQRKCKK